MSDEDRMRKVMDRAKLQDQSHGEDWESFRNRAHRRLFMNRALISGVAVLFFAAGITAGAFILRDDGPKSQNILPVSTDEPAPEPTAEPTPSAVEPETKLVEVWFTQDELLFRELHEVPGVPEVEEVGAMALRELLDPDGPSLDEVGTAIPPGVEVIRTRLSEEVGIYEVVLSDEFESGGGSASMQMRVAQVVFTLTQFPTVEGVLIMVGEDAREYLGGEGLSLTDAFTRADFGEDIQPPITVENPKPGAAVTSPVMISGTANVFEANVNIRILDENGEVLAETFVTATCGTGSRGTYEKNVKFTVDHEQEGIIEVLTYSMEDGSPMWAVQTPVTLLP